MKRMTFKNILARDVKQVFLNPAEFGEVHKVNGTPMTIVLDDVENIEREKKMKSSMDGIYARQILFYVSTAEFGPLPGQGDLVSLDGKEYMVMDATDECGIYAITLEANREAREVGSDDYIHGRPDPV